MIAAIVFNIIFSVNNFSSIGDWGEMWSNLLSPNNAIVATVNNAPQKIIDDGLESLGVEISARSSLVVDRQTGVVLESHNPDEVRSIASITKLMTALVFLDHNPGFATEIIMKPEFEREGGRLHVASGTPVLVRDVFDSMLVGSLNNCAVALSASTSDLSPEDFVAAMNAKAIALGMRNTHFSEPTGLSSLNKSTASDLVILMQEALRHQDISEVINLSEYVFRLNPEDKGEVIKNTNQLFGSYLNKDGYKIIGSKTGYIDDAGYCLLTALENSAGNDVVAVVLGSADQESRFYDLKALVQWVFDNYRWR